MWKFYTKMSSFTAADEDINEYIHTTILPMICWLMEYAKWYTSISVAMCLCASVCAWSVHTDRVNDTGTVAAIAPSTRSFICCVYSSIPPYLYWRNRIHLAVTHCPLCLITHSSSSSIISPLICPYLFVVHPPLFQANLTTNMQSRSLVFSSRPSVP